MFVGHHVEKSATIETSAKLRSYYEWNSIVSSRCWRSTIACRFPFIFFLFHRCKKWHELDLWVALGLSIAASELRLVMFVLLGGVAAGRAVLPKPAGRPSPATRTPNGSLVLLDRTLPLWSPTVCPCAPSLYLERQSDHEIRLDLASV